MSQYIIDTFTPLLQPFTLHVVFLSQGYSNRWLRSSDGKPNLAYVQLERMVVDALQTCETLQPSFFKEYRLQLEEVLFQKLVEIGKGEGARKRVSQRAEEISNALCAIIVEEQNGHVHCLNKLPEQPVAIFSPETSTICVERHKWSVKAQEKGGKKTKDTTSDEAYNESAINSFSLSDWWHKNHIIVWISLVMLTILPAGMIWVMLQVKQMAEEANTPPKTILAPKQSVVDSQETDSLKGDTVVSSFIGNDDNIHHPSTK